MGGQLETAKAEIRQRTDIVVHCAGRIGDRPVPILRVVAAVEPPEHDSWAAQAKVYERDGRALAEAIVQHLPGATVDQLLIALLQRRASMFRIAFGEPV